MNVLTKIQNYYQKGLLKNALKEKIRVTLSDLNLTSYFFFHNAIGDNAVLRTEMGRWRCYTKLKKKYQHYLDSLPLYEPTGIKNKTIWWCWLQGEDAAPPLCKACLSSIRKHFPDYKIVIINEGNIFDYVTFPTYIIDKYNQGKICRAHYADLLRTLLLANHGGVWIDSTVFCTGYDDYIFDEPFFVFQNVFLAGKASTAASNWLISADKEHPIMLSMWNILSEYWKENDKAIHYFIYHFFFDMVVKKYTNLWQSVPRYSNIPPHYLQHELLEPYSNKLATRIKHQSDFHKLTYKVSAKGLNTPDLVINKIISNQF